MQYFVRALCFERFYQRCRDIEARHVQMRRERAPPPTAEIGNLFLLVHRSTPQGLKTCHIDSVYQIFPIYPQSPPEHRLRTSSSETVP
jgi:hypothetical protein